MGTYTSSVNSGIFYLIVALVLAFVVAMCVVFLVKSYKAGIAIGMDKKELKRIITSSATFTLLPSISILLGVVALSGTLGVPFSWLRLSVIGSLQYELNVADIAAQKGLGLAGVHEVENMGQFVTVALVMSAGILGGIFCCVFFLKKYLSKLSSKPKKEETVGEKKPNFAEHATTAMFIGLCAAYIGSYIGKVLPTAGEYYDYMPLLTALVAGGVMAIFEFFVQKKNMKTLENFSLAASMLIAMIAAVVVQLIL